MATRVLIVDDTPVFRDAAQAVLVQRGYEVVGQAATGAEALEAASRLAPDAVLLDVRLPDAGGLEVAAALTRAHPTLAVLLASADRADPDPAALSRSGARGFVLKSRFAVTDLERFWPAP